MLASPTARNGGLNIIRTQVKHIYEDLIWDIWYISSDELGMMFVSEIGVYGTAYPCMRIAREIYDKPWD
jgi:hypothetical protein